MDVSLYSLMLLAMYLIFYLANREHIYLTSRIVFALVSNNGTESIFTQQFLVNFHTDAVSYSSAVSILGLSHTQTETTQRACVTRSFSNACNLSLS